MRNLFRLFFVLFFISTTCSSRLIAGSGDTLFLEKDTLILKWNGYGEELRYKEYIQLTDSIQKMNVELFRTDTTLAILATKLYNTTVTLGRDFLVMHEAYATYYWDYLFQPCVYCLQALPSGSCHYSLKYDIYVFGNQFTHSRSRFKIIQ